MNRTIVDNFISIIRKKSASKAKKENSDFIFTIKIYKNGFIAAFPNSNNSNINFYPFFTANNFDYLKKIQNGILPRELLNKERDYSKVQNLCLVVEDYSQQNYFCVDNSMKTTTIIIKMINGKILYKKVNLFHSINDIKQMIEEDSNLKMNEYTFIYGYPPKQIEQNQMSESIEMLCLENSTLIQKKI